jgi:hypothetical protein
MAQRAGNQSRGGGRHNKEPRGGQGRRARGGAKSQPAKRALRLAQPRVRDALSAARTDREWLAAEAAEVERIVRQWTAELARKAVEATVAGRPAPAPPALHDRSNRSAGLDRGWTLGQARVLLTDGYPLARVCERTGWGGWWFRDIVGNDGYARGAESWAS